MKFVIVLALVAAVSAKNIYDPLSAREHRIVGGVETTPHEFPSIVNEGSHSCGATLIHPQWALTAAHCVPFYQIVAGDHNIRVTEGNEVRVTITQNIAHPNYQSPGQFSNDAALLKLSAPVDLSEFVQLAVLPPTDFAPTGNSVVVGWGTTEFGGVSDVLRKVTVPLVDQAACIAAYGSSVDDTMICAGIADKDSCQGDSGGPLFCDGPNGQVHCGIVSWGRGCGLDGYPGVYSRTSVFVDWINETIEQN